MCLNIKETVNFTHTSASFNSIYFKQKRSLDSNISQEKPVQFDWINNNFSRMRGKHIDSHDRCSNLFACKFAYYIWCSVLACLHSQSNCAFLNQSFSIRAILYLSVHFISKLSDQSYSFSIRAIRAIPTIRACWKLFRFLWLAG